MRCSPLWSWASVCSTLSLAATVLTAQTQFDELRGRHLPGERLCGRAVACADVDGDGDVDVAIGHLGAPSRLYLNVGGQLVDAPPGALPSTQINIAALAFADVDGDGDLDLAEGNDPLFGRQDRLFLNNGKGCFTDETAQRLPAIPTATKALSFGDVDGDGDQDLLVASRDTLRIAISTAQLWENDGTGRFADATAQRLTTTPGATTGVLADFDADGDLDAFFGTTQSDELHINDGTGRFTLRRGSVPAIAVSTGSAVVADVDADGDLDVLALGGDLLYENDGTGYFVEISATALTAVATQIYAAAFVDENDDGNPDLVATTADGLAVYRARSAGRFSIAPRITPLDTGWSSVAGADIDGNGAEDVVAATGNTSSHGVFFNPGFLNGTAALFTEPLSTVLAAGDFNGNGRTDVATWSRLEAKIWYQRAADIIQGPPGTLPIPTETVGFALPVDIDGVGGIDLALIVQPARGSNRVQLLIRRSSFVDETASRLGTEYTDGLAAGDVDGDGDTDLVTASSGVRLLRNEGGSFVGSAITSVGVFGGNPILADADVDGDLDLFAAPNLYLNNGAGEFELRWVHPERQSFHAVADVDGDGDGDLFTRGSFSRLGLWLNNGTGIFEDATAARLPQVVSQYSDFAIGDLDSDGAPDIYATAYGPTAVPDEWFVNDGSGHYQPAPPGRAAAAGAGAQLGPLADWDTDSDLDVMLWRGGGPVCGAAGFFVVRNLHRQLDVPLLPQSRGSLVIDAYLVDGGTHSTRFAVPWVSTQIALQPPIAGLGQWALPPASIPLPAIAVTGTVGSASFRLPALSPATQIVVQAIMIPSTVPSTWRLSNAVQRRVRQ